MSHDHLIHTPNDAVRAGRLREHALRGAILLTFGFALVEAFGGWWTGSLALIADAGHMVTDSAALLLAWLAARLSQRPPNARMSYGYRRAEVLSAFLNALLMLGILALLVPAAIERFQQPREVLGGGVMVVAFVGLMVNLAVLRVLHAADRGALNTRGALLHVLGDLLGSIAALAAGLVIWLTGWTPIDALLSLFIAALILVSAGHIVRDVLRVLMEAVPAGITLEGVRARLLQANGVSAVHDLHIWTLAGDRLLLSAHLGIERNEDWPRLLVELQRLLRDEFAISHATLQPEPPEYMRLLHAASDGHLLDDHSH